MLHTIPISEIYKKLAFYETLLQLQLDDMDKYSKYFRNISKHFQNNQGQNPNFAMNSRKIPDVSGIKSTSRTSRIFSPCCSPCRPVALSMILTLYFLRGIWTKVWITEKDRQWLPTTEPKQKYLQIQARPEFSNSQ